MFNNSTIDVTNEVLTDYYGIFHSVVGGSYLTEIDEKPWKQNKFDSFTKNENPVHSHMFLSITAVSVEELDLAPERSMSEAAARTRKFMNKPPRGLIDVDLGPGI